MPIYEYVCDKCQKEFSELVYSEADLQAVACPACGSKVFHKLMSTSAVGAAQAKSSSSSSASSGGSCCGGSCACGF